MYIWLNIPESPGYVTITAGNFLSLFDDPVTSIQVDELLGVPNAADKIKESIGLVSLTEFRDIDLTEVCNYMTAHGWALTPMYNLYSPSGCCAVCFEKIVETD